jgi:hypothetical protein
MGLLCPILGRTILAVNQSGTVEMIHSVASCICAATPFDECGMTYSKTQLRDFFNHLFLELQGTDSDQLQAYREKYGIELIPSSSDLERAEHQDWLLEHFKKLIPMFKGLTDRMNDPTPQLGTEKISKTFRRVIKTADYETVEVVNMVEHEIEYSSALERLNKMEAMTRQATEELAADLAAVCKKLGVSEKRVSVRQY